MQLYDFLFHWCNNCLSRAQTPWLGSEHETTNTQARPKQQPLRNMTHCNVCPVGPPAPIVEVLLLSMLHQQEPFWRWSALRNRKGLACETSYNRSKNYSANNNAGSYIHMTKYGNEVEWLAVSGLVNRFMRPNWYHWCQLIILCSEVLTITSKPKRL